MVVKLRFQNGHRVERKKGKNRKAALAGASFFSLGSVSCFSLGVWPVCADLGWAGPFVITDGILSHGQVWIAGAIVLQIFSWKLTRYARVVEAPPAQAEKPQSKAAAGF